MHSVNVMMTPFPNWRLCCNHKTRHLECGSTPFGHCVAWTVIQQENQRDLLSDASSEVRQTASHAAALHRDPLALDQLPAGDLRAEDIAPLLTTGDSVLQQAAIDVLTRRPQWTDESIKLVDTWLSEADLDETRATTLVGIVRVLQAEPSMRQLLTRHPKTAARPLLERLKAAVQNQVTRLNELEDMLDQKQGHVDHGRELFFGKAQCHLCHTATCESFVS